MSLEQWIDIDKQLLLNLNGSDSVFVDGLATILTDGVTWIPLYVALLYVVIKNSENKMQILYIICAAALCVLLAGTLNDTFVKPGVARPRPTHDLHIGHLVDVVDGYRGGHYGFFSSHAANTFSIAVFFSLLMRGKMLSLMLIIWSLVNCWTRIYLGVHYPGDILCGILWGGFIGTVIYLLYNVMYKKFNKSNKYISTKYTSNGYMYSDMDIVIMVLLLTYVYAFVGACFVLE